jgi:hypothetical protein
VWEVGARKKMRLQGRVCERRASARIEGEGGKDQQAQPTKFP